LPSPEIEIAEGVTTMSHSDDRRRRGNDVGPDKSYVVGNKKPPLHTRFKPGQSGNPSGRPKGRRNFDTTLLKEFYKPVLATVHGKPVKVTNDKLFAFSLVKDGITKGPQSKRELANAIERAEARLAAMAEAKKKAEPEEDPIFVWDEEAEKRLQELIRASDARDEPKPA
jgi:hypothetical protein